VDEGPKGSGRIVLSANSVELGENQGEIEATITGPSAQIAFNYRFLSECLATVKSERVSLALSGSSSPGLVRQVDPKSDDDEDNFNHVIMPMHTVT
jgi:DNA polymerase-3 subunit beta